MAVQTVNVGIVGAGLMGREIAGAIARWPALLDHPVRPKLTAVCDINPGALDWFDQIETVRHRVVDYRDLLAEPDVDVVYVAVRHDLHEQLYVDAIDAGKDLLAEKPFGIDLPAAERIVAAARARPDVFVRCSSEMPFYPGAQAAFNAVHSGELGALIEATNYLSHSSDLDLTKPINWKRQAQFCGHAGVMNDLGMHACHVPLRLGWQPSDVYAVLQDLVPSRPGPDGNATLCDTYENATLVCTVDEGGLKTSVRYYLNDVEEEMRARLLEEHRADLCAAFQQAVVDVLVDRIRRAVRETSVKHVAIVGGVSANSRLRAEAEAAGQADGFSVYTPRLEYCMDNAAMIAATGHYKLQAGHRSPLTLSVQPRLAL